MKKQIAPKTLRLDTQTIRILEQSELTTVGGGRPASNGSAKQVCCTSNQTSATIEDC